MADSSTRTDDTTTGTNGPAVGVPTAAAGVTGSETGDDNAEDAAEAPAGSPSRPAEIAPRQPTDAGDPQRVAVRLVARDAEPYLPPGDLAAVDAWWRAANYLSVGQIYLMDNPLLREPLRPEHIKPRLLGHWGTTPGLNLIYAHLNRAIIQRDLDLIYVFGPGHGGPAAVAGAWLDGTYSEIYGHITQDERGMRLLFKQFSFPGGVPSHVAPETPGSIHEGGELGYALSHAAGAAFDNPDLIVACVVGDGEAETGPLATSWHGNKFLDPQHDGAVLPILHLNGYKIANPTVLARIPEDELVDLLVGYGWQPVIVSGHEPEKMHHAFARALDRCLDSIAEIRRAAREDGVVERPRWPMIVLRSPKGWTGPKSVDGKQAEGSWRSHQVPLDQTRTNDAHRRQLEEWMRSYQPEELFTDDGRPVDLVRSLAPDGQRRMSDNLHTNGGKLLKDLRMPDFRDYAVEVEHPGTGTVEATKVLGTFLRDVMRKNLEQRNFRVFAPDENNSNRLQDVLQVTPRTWEAEMIDGDDNLG
ncbi:MAG: phosphoketolase family protein, partial [Kineosporiaceae bacterium]